jgi:hypothetical protein
MSTPAIACIYSRSGAGKSVDALYTAPTALFLTPAPGGLSASVRLTGIPPREQQVASIDHALRVLRADKTAKVVVLDDFSILAERSHLALDGSGAKGWAVWQRLQKGVLLLREHCINNGITLIMNAHEAPPKTGEDGTFMMGGPKMPSKAMSTALPHIASLVLRCDHDSFAAPPAWSGCYVCNPSDSRWLTKDRYCVVGKKAPMNLREILVRAAEAGHDVVVPTRAPGLEWLDQAAEGVARGLSTGQILKAADAAGILSQAFAGRDPRHLRWAWRDGCARYTLRQSDDLFSMFSTTATATGAVAG